jgi:hypothetical protein
MYLVIFTLTIGLSALAPCLFSDSSRVDRQPDKDVSAFGRDSKASPKTDQKFDPFKYLPPESSIDNVGKDIAFADLDGDGRKEITIFYTVHSEDQYKANILVLRQDGQDYSPLWEDIKDGSSGFADPTGVYEMNKNGKPQIVAYRTVGASCPGILDIYEFAKGGIGKITGDWAGECQSDLEIKDLDGDNVREIIFRRLKYGLNRNIYHWDGKQYVQSNSQFVKEYSSELEKLIESIYYQSPLPAHARVTWCKQASQIYVLQQRYADAIKVCNDVLRVIDDPNLTKPGTDIRGDETPEIRNRIAAYFELERIREKGTIYRLLGDIHKAAGDLKQAKADYSRAHMFETQAGEIESKLPH